MSNAVLKGNASGTGTVTLETPDTNSDRTISLPDDNGTMLYANASGNVGIGTSSPDYKLDVQNGTGRIYNASFPSLRIQNSDTGTGSSDGLLVEMSGTNALFVNYESSNMIFSTANTERMRITSGGALLIGTTTQINAGLLNLAFDTSTFAAITTRPTNNAGYDVARFFNSSTTQIGSIACTTSGTSFVTTSDYRLKENIAPMTGALDKVALLKPVTYKWKSTGEDAQGFIAHELQAVVPDCVVGDKDAIDEDGNIKPQGIDTSFLVATLTAAIQELKAELDATKAEVAALKGAE
jgi:hypothetical protein